MNKNELIKILQTIAKLNSNLGEAFKAKAYKTSCDALEAFEDEIDDDLKSLQPILGKSSISKLREYVETGRVGFIEQQKTNTLHTFIDIYGVGPKKAKELSLKFKSIDELRENQDVLNSKQKIGLKFYEDMQLRIPRAEIDEYALKIRAVVQTFDGCNAEIVGSYRRGAETSGDIDVIFTAPCQSTFKKFVSKFHENGLIVEMLSFGVKKSMCFAKLDDERPARRVDFMYTSPNEYYFAILYFTGSKLFNINMRSVAKQMGYSLNEYGLVDVKTKKLIDERFTSEESIFEFLNVPYRTPTLR